MIRRQSAYGTEWVSLFARFSIKCRNRVYGSRVQKPQGQHGHATSIRCWSDCERVNNSHVRTRNKHPSVPPPPDTWRGRLKSSTKVPTSRRTSSRVADAGLWKNKSHVACRCLPRLCRELSFWGCYASRAYDRDCSTIRSLEKIMCFWNVPVFINHSIECWDF